MRWAVDGVVSSRIKLQIDESQPKKVVLQPIYRPFLMPALLCETEIPSTEISRIRVKNAPVSYYD